MVGIRFPPQPPDPWFTKDMLPVDKSDLPPDAGNDEATPARQIMARTLSCVVVLQADDLVKQDILQAIRSTVEEIRATIPDCRVDWLGDAPSRTGLLRRPRFVLPEREISDERWQRVRDELKQHPLVAGQLLSNDGTTMLILLSDSRTSTEATARRIVRQQLEPLGIQFWITGEMVMGREDRHRLEKWGGIVLIVSGLCVAIVGLIMLRDLRRSLAVSCGPFFALTLALGWEAFLGLPFNEMASANIPVFVLVLAFADSVHILLAVEEEYGHCQDHRKASHRAMKRMLRPCFLTSLTTSLAFASLMLSNQPMVYGFGRNAAFAVCMAFFGVVTAMPLSSAECVRRCRPGRARVVRGRDRWIQRPILLSVRNPAVTTGVFFLLTIGLLFYCSRTLYPDDRIDLRVDNNQPSYVGLSVCDERLNGLRQISVHLEWPEDATDADIWQVLTSIQEQVADSRPFSAPMSILNAIDLLPGKKSDRHLRYSDRLARGRLEDLWNREERFAAVEFRVRDRGVQHIEQDLRELRGLLVSLEESHPGFRLEVGGQGLVESALVQRTISEMSWSVLLAGGTILAVIWIAYRRLSFALFSILPNTFALAFCISVRAWLTPSLDIASTCAASICLGIAVDDTIHFLEAMRHAKSPPGSRMRILNAGHLVGRALVITTITLLFGFATVYIAPLPTLRLFATMVISMLPVALLGDLVILPAVLSLFRQGRKTK